MSLYKYKKRKRTIDRSASPLRSDETSSSEKENCSTTPKKPKGHKRVFHFEINRHEGGPIVPISDYLKDISPEDMQSFSSLFQALLKMENRGKCLAVLGSPSDKNHPRATGTTQRPGRTLRCDSLHKRLYADDDPDVSEEMRSKRLAYFHQDMLLKDDHRVYAIRVKRFTLDLNPVVTYDRHIKYIFAEDFKTLQHRGIFQGNDLLSQKTMKEMSHAESTEEVRRKKQEHMISEIAYYSFETPNDRRYVHHCKTCLGFFYRPKGHSSCVDICERCYGLLIQDRLDALEERLQCEFSGYVASLCTKEQHEKFKKKFSHYVDSSPSKQA